MLDVRLVGCKQAAQGSGVQVPQGIARRGDPLRRRLGHTHLLTRRATPQIRAIQKIGLCMKIANEDIWSVASAWMRHGPHTSSKAVPATREHPEHRKGMTQSLKLCMAAEPEPS